MKMLLANRKGIVSIIAMMLYIFGVQGILGTSLLFVGCSVEDGSEEIVTPDTEELVPPSPEPPPPIEAPEPPPPVAELANKGVCAVGMKLKPGEKCSYVVGEANVVFFVQEDGTACREGGPVFHEVFGAKVRVNKFNICVNQDIEQDDAFGSDFSFKKNPDGSWDIGKKPE